MSEPAALNVKLWGIRGSLPAPHAPDLIEARLKKTLESFVVQGQKEIRDIPAFLGGLAPEIRGGYGGNTVCVQVSGPDGFAIVDAGSGIRRLGDRMMAGPCGKGKGEAHIFFTHFHWDHLIGLPFFSPIFIPGNRIHLHAVQPDLEECIRGIFKKPYFPVPFEALGSTVIFHRLEPRKQLEISGVTITPYQLDHPDPCWGYRFERNGKSYAHCVDTECTRVSREDIGPDLPLYANADLMLFDAQYTLLETVEKMNWGHSAAPIGLDIALREGVKHVLFAHHDPGSEDEKIADAERQTRDYYESYLELARIDRKMVTQIKWGFAREGQSIDL
jgi:phosphoribosyl 1,2-cyclic phosphodiesterase